MTSGFAPAAVTASAVSSRLVRLRATSTIFEKSRARRIAVARPMPWLAPVTRATECDIRDIPYLPLLAHALVNEIADGLRDLSAVRLQSEVARIEEVDACLREVARKRLGTRRKEEWIVPAPHRLVRRLVHANVTLKCGVECDVALVVSKEVELNVVYTGAGLIVIIEVL